MKIIANWKANMDVQKIKDWIDKIKQLLSEQNSERVEIIVAPSFIHIPIIEEDLENLRISVSAQDLSIYENGAHTGEVTAKMIKEFASYVIIGHSEKRLDDNLNKVNTKIFNSVKENLKPIICFSNKNEFVVAKDYLITKNIDLSDVHFAYEPIYAIGTNNPASIEEIKKVKDECGLQSIIYGGSVDSQTISQYANNAFIDGFLVGSASLNPDEFIKIVKYFS